MKSTAHTTDILPEGYVEIDKIDLKENRRQYWLVNGLSLAMGLLLAVPAVFVVPLSALYEGGSGMIILRLVALVVAMVAYVLLHEAVHGVFIRLFSGRKPFFGIGSTYAYAGSTAYFNRRHYLIIALAPVVLWGIVLAVPLPFLPRAWFWVVYFVQVINLSGAAGDLYVTVRMLRMPPDILVQDSGMAMTVYSYSRNRT